MALDALVCVTNEKQKENCQMGIMYSWSQIEHQLINMCLLDNQKWHESRAFQFKILRFRLVLVSAEIYGQFAVSVLGLNQKGGFGRLVFILDL